MKFVVLGMIVVAWNEGFEAAGLLGAVFAVVLLFTGIGGAFGMLVGAAAAAFRVVTS